MKARIAHWSPARRGLVALMSGVAGGQLIALLASPVVGRLFPPGQYGPFAVINAVVVPLGTVAAWRLELAIPLPVREGMARDVARLGLRLCAAAGLIGIVIAWVTREAIANSLGQNQSVADLLPWGPLIAAEVGAVAVLTQLAIRRKAYGAIARRSVLQACATISSQIVAGLLGMGAQGLVLGLAIGQGVGVLTLGSSVWAGAKVTAHATAIQILRRFRSFPLLLAPAGLLNSLGLQAPVLIASAVFGAEVSGWLGMTQRILALPIALLGTTLAQVYLGEFGEAKRHASKDLIPLFIRTSRRLAAVGAALALLVITLAPFAFSLVLGRRWEASGYYAQALAVGLVVQMVASPLSQTLIVMGKNAQQILWDIARLFACSAAVFGGYKLKFSATSTMWLLGTTMAVMYACLWSMSWRAVKNFANDERESTS